MDIEVENGQDDIYNASQSQDEEQRLGGSSPLVTIIKLSIGPMLFMTLTGFQDACDLYFVKNGYGTDGVTIISISAAIRAMVMAFASIFPKALQ